MTTKDMTPITGLAQQHDDWTAFYERFLDADGHIHHRFTHVVTNGGETIRRAEETSAETMRRYLAWRASLAEMTRACSSVHFMDTGGIQCRPNVAHAWPSSTRGSAGTGTSPGSV